MRLKTHVAALAALLVIPGATAVAQGTLTGVVRDSSGAAVPSAQVVVAGPRLQVLTDSSGRYRIEQVAAGPHRVVARQVGFRAAVLDVLVADGMVLTADITLAALPVSLAAIDVTPSRFGVGETIASAAATLTRDDLDAVPQLGEDVYRAVGRLPGLTAHDYSARFRVRGAPNDEVLARLDGVELVDPFHMKDLDGALSIVDAETIGRLDLVTGGFTSEYGDRLTGLMLLETLAPTTARSRTTLGLSLTALRATTRGEFARGRGRWLGAARRGYLDIVLSLIGSDENIDPTYYDVAGKVEYDLAPGHTVSAHLLHAADRMSFQDDDDPRLTSEYRSSYGWFGWRGQLGRLTGNAVLSASTHRTLRGGNGAFGGRDTMLLSDDRRYRLTGLRQDWALALHDRAMLRFGLDVRSQAATYDYTANRQLRAIRNDSLVAIGDTTALALDTAGPVLAFYLAPRLQPISALTLEAGVRVDRQSPPRTTRAGPRINAVLALGRTTLRAAWGAYDQAHSLYRLDVPDGDATIRPAERAEHRIVAVEHAFRNGLRVRLEGYNRISTRLRPRYLDPLVTTDVFPEFSTSRIRIDPTQGRARGVELLVEQSSAEGGGWSAFYALADSRELVNGAWLARERDQRHTVNVDISLAPGPGWLVSGAWYFHTGWPATATVFSLDTVTNAAPVLVAEAGPLFAERLPAYHRMDVRVTRRFQFRRSTLRVFVEVFNLYNRGNAQGIDYLLRIRPNQVQATRAYETMLPRLPSVGVSWEF